jgi:alkanesulfonate monooxygenase SsuD/methylene tetrahydromethanopterin reductase-like flavin-dependent oxidoreductase (luciferase family)
MQFGVSVEAPVGWDELLGFARVIDAESRFTSIWIADAMIANGPPDDPRLDAWTALAAIAHATDRVRLGVMVSGNAYRHPALLAKIVTTIDQISNGRVELGIGAGWPGENRRYGIDFGTRAERVERLEEALQVIKALWTQQRPVFRGKHYQLDAPPFSPKPVQWPHPPIVIGGGSDAMLRLIAKYADASNPMIDVREAHAKIDAYCAEIGRDAKEIRRTNSYPFFMHDDPAVVERAKAIAREQYGATEEQIAGNLFGTPDGVRTHVRAAADAGIDEVILFQLPRVHLPSLLRFSEEIIPSFSGSGVV